MVCYPRGKRPKPSAGFRIVPPTPAPAGDYDRALWRAAAHYAKTVLDGDASYLKKIQDRFEEVHSLSNRDRMVLACSYEQFLNGADEVIKKECAKDVFSIITKLEAPAFSLYFDAIKDYVEPYRRAADTFSSDPPRSFDPFAVWRSSFPIDINASIFLAFLRSFTSSMAGGRSRAPGGKDADGRID